MVCYCRDCGKYFMETDLVPIIDDAGEDSRDTCPFCGGDSRVFTGVHNMYDI